MKFSAFNLKKEVIEALDKLGYVDLTPVQEVTIPKALKNESVVVQSETGSGKTHSFLIPIINNVEYNDKIQAIIISPTRELARQTYNFAKEFMPYLKGLNIKLFIGGEETKEDMKSFDNGAQIVIATAGRLNYLIKTSKVEFTDVKTIVLDEADMLMEPSFISDIDYVIKRSNKPQIEVFSATINKQVEQFLKKYIGADYVLTLSKKAPTSKTVNHYFINTKHSDLFDNVVRFIRVKNPFLLLIFASNKKDVNSLYSFLSEKKIKCGILSGDLEARERRSMLRRINKGEFRIVVCSDIASRGLDIDDVSDVLSIDLTENLEYYFHRAGRTGRNFKTGNSYVFYDNDHTKLPLKLIDGGLKANYLKFDGDKLVEDGPIVRQKRKFKNKETELDKEIRKTKYMTKSKKVKPNYKKKVKLAIEKVKKKHRREMIQKDIRRQRVERYKAEGKKNRDY